MTVTVIAPVEELLRRVRLSSPDRHEPVVVERLPAPLRMVGLGTDAAVVAHPAHPDRVYKVYADEALPALADEHAAYELLAGSTLFASCLGRGDRYLVLSYEPGPTLYDCLVEGIPIGASVMADVEAARNHARRAGLHPKDVHLKNVIVQGSKAKMIDVSKYVAPGDADPVWEALAAAYERYYPAIRGRAVPVWLIETVKRAYREQPTGGPAGSLDAFARRMLRLHKALRLVPGRRTPLEAA